MVQMVMMMVVVIVDLRLMETTLMMVVMMSWASVSFTNDGNHWPPPCNWLCSLVSFACHQPLASSLSFPILIGIKFLANFIVDIFIIVIKIIALIIIIIATSRWLVCPAFLLFSFKRNARKNLTNARKRPHGWEEEKVENDKWDAGNQLDEDHSEPRHENNNREI